MSRTRKEGEPEIKVDTSVQRRNSLDEREGEPEIKADEPVAGCNSLVESQVENIEEPGAPSAASGSEAVEAETKDEVMLEQEQEINIESAFICPITHQLFLSPVTLFPMGITVEREVAEWLVANEYGYPILRSEPRVQIVENRLATDLLAHYLRQHPEAQSRQYVNGTYDFSQIAPDVRPPDAAYQDVLLPPEAVNDGINGGPEGGYHRPLPVERAEEKDDGLVGLPLAVAIKKNSLASTDFKGILFGETLAKRGFSKAATAQVNNNFIATIGIDFNFISLPSGTYVIHDMAGQERFRTITSSYLRGAGFVMLFSPDNNRLAELRDYDYEIYQINYDLAARTATLSRNDNPYEHGRPQVRVAAAEVRTITESLLPLISSLMVPLAAAPQPARAPVQGFFNRIANLVQRDDKEEKNLPRP